MLVPYPGPANRPYFSFFEQFLNQIEKIEKRENFKKQWETSVHTIKSRWIQIWHQILIKACISRGIDYFYNVRLGSDPGLASIFSTEDVPQNYKSHFKSRNNSFWGILTAFFGFWGKKTQLLSFSGKKGGNIGFFEGKHDQSVKNWTKKHFFWGVK